MRLAGKNALITGGTSGIGRKIVERFVNEGATVYFSGRRVPLGEEVARLTGAIFIEADAAIEEDAQRTMKRITDRQGRLDILVNNAGGPGPTGRIDSLSLRDFDATIAVHL